MLNNQPSSVAIMNKDRNFLNEIYDRYSNIEHEIEDNLKSLQQNEEKIEFEWKKDEPELIDSVLPITKDEAKQRNANIIKELEIAKARLRSRATYSPLETILAKAIKNYRKEMSLIPSKKVYGPTYV